MTELTGNMPATALTPSAGLGAVSKQVALNLEALQRLSQDYVTALGASVSDRASLHDQVDSLLARLNALEARRPRVAPVVTVPAMLSLLGGAASVDVTLTWGVAWADTAYEVVPVLDLPSSLLGKASAVVKSKTAAGCVVTVTTTAVLAASTATLRALSVSST